MLDKETVTSQGIYEDEPELEDEAFFECLHRAREHIESEHLIECFDRVMEIKKE
ncbi:MAG: hypothetical protein KGY76_08070 [Candidatus Thermoplasmatota archaeon]|nr:hypothetical protein [Candidatus Thermoplasmatota archaeon]